ncbi:type II CRISPR RNA-guided endonuclease Cas9 [uncultured Draconibacterium sp.]|uniref:type II CRISPR RNA-guided endonuclease Cas9 n=1 Tax=uncultured Draconibacterium sp. TaxID=1573823 RepID=UPI0032177155
MAKILGLDLGTNSIGWAVVDSDTQKILNTGVRIFPEGVEPKTIGQGDKEQSKNATRRDKRQMRRQFYRKRLRKIKLLQVLIQQEMCPLTIDGLSKWKNWSRTEKAEGRKFPDSEKFIDWIKLNPYDLREKALEEELTLHELGRIFYHLIQRRGFLSNRKGTEDSTIFTKGKPDENILPINDTKAKIGNRTLGGYLNSIACKDGEPYKNITDENGKEIRVRGRYTVRDMYIDEFEKIWSVQKEFLEIDNKKVEAKRARELRGTVNNKRNKNKIDHLKIKFGESNVDIKIDDKGKTKVITTEHISLKEFLAGRIDRIKDEAGEETLQFKSNESVLFWQRPLRSQKGLLSNCRFEDNLPVIKENGDFLLKPNGERQTRGKKPCPISHPEFELFRAYQFVNNISYGKNQKLTPEQKKEVLALINKNDGNFDFSKIPDALKLNYEKFNYGDKQKVAGNPTIKALKPLFSDDIWDKHYEEIWHCFYFYEDNDKLFEKLKKDFGFKKDIEAVKKVRIKVGYSNVSLKAIRNILPFLEKGYQYDRAVILGGVKNAFGKRWEFFKEFHDNIEKEILSILREENKDGEAIEKIKEHLASPVFNYGFEKDDPHFLHLYHHSQEVEKQDELNSLVPIVENLRNPIVQQGLNETRRLVNYLVQKYQKEFGSGFHFDQIKVEMGRELRNNKDGRQEMSFRIRENEAKNDDARQRLAEYGLQPSRENIQKYLMFKEIEERSGKAQCPYTGKVISVSDLLGRDNAVQIEHIIPFSVSLDDSFGNKTLCEANFNREKSEKTPYLFYKENPDPNLWGVTSWEAVEERAFRLLPYRKAKKFTAKREFEKSDFIQRQLNDSRYIAKKSVELLSHICNDVRVMPGQLTAELRHLWGLNNILQPVQNLGEHTFDVDGENSIAHYVVTNETGEVVSIHRKQNIRPSTNSNEILVTGNVNKKKFTSKYFKIDMETPDLPDGKYWVKLNIGDNLHVIPKYIDKPEIDEKSIVFKGNVEKGYFKNDTYGRIKADIGDGSYWAKFEILNVKFETPVKDNQPKIKRNQVMLFGNVLNGQFKCFIYQCETNLRDGKYWIILDLNPASVEFIRSVNPKPEVQVNELLITATIDEDGVLNADIDKEYQVQTDSPTGKYYVVMDIITREPKLYSIENEPPKLENGQQLIEGNIWVDKYTGEIKFDPKKNRDDHRHHAIDAITIALTEQGYLQRLSTYNAQRKEKQRQKLDSTEKFPEPWNGFTNDVARAASAILISHKKNNKTLTKTKKGFGVRGQLHEQTLYGKKDYCKSKEFTSRVSIKKLKFKKTKGQATYLDDIIDAGIQNAIYKTIKENLKNEEDKRIIEDILKRYHNIGNIKTKKAQEQEAKELNILRTKINSQVEKILQEENFFLKNEGNRYKKLKKESIEERHPVPIKKVKVLKVLGHGGHLKELSSYSKKKNRVVKGNQYVNPGNNHHILIYLNSDGKLSQEAIQLWAVIERKSQGDEIYQLPEDGVSIVTTLETNDMFILGLSNDEFESNINNRAFLSRYLYRVQNISDMYYNFRFHLASTLDKKEEWIYIQSLSAWEKLNPIKVKIDILGNIKKV